MTPCEQTHGTLRIKTAHSAGMRQLGAPSNELTPSLKGISSGGDVVSGASGYDILRVPAPTCRMGWMKWRTLREPSVSWLP